MKIKQEVKEVNVGVQVELSNVELLVLATETNKILNSCPILRTAVDIDKDSVLKESNVRVDATALVNVLNFIKKFTQNTVSIDEAENSLFGTETLVYTDQDVQDLVENSLSFGKINLPLKKTKIN
jgi:hypothetical protein